MEYQALELTPSMLLEMQMIMTWILIEGHREMELQMRVGMTRRKYDLDIYKGALRNTYESDVFTWTFIHQDTIYFSGRSITCTLCMLDRSITCLYSSAVHHMHPRLSPICHISLQFSPIHHMHPRLNPTCHMSPRFRLVHHMHPHLSSIYHMSLRFRSVHRLHPYLRLVPPIISQHFQHSSSLDYFTPLPLSLPFFLP